MPIEFVTLKNQPQPLARCPKCAAEPFEAFLRGTVHSRLRRFFRRPYCCVICALCKEIVGFEKP